MGWTQQGYNAQGFNPSLGIKSDYWYVECNGEESDEIEEYHELRVDVKWTDKIKIVYGMSSREYFRGYVLTNDIQLVKSLLNTFNKFLVYERKYGGEKEFNVEELTILQFLGIALFFETNAKVFPDDTIISMDEITEDLLDELIFGIRHGFMDAYGKSRDEIAKDLRKEIRLLKNIKQ